MIKKDKRYQNVKDHILSGRIKTIRDIFSTKAISPYRVYTDLGINNARFKQRVENVGKFSFDDMFMLAELIDIETIKVLELVNTQWNEDKKTTGKNRKQK